MSLNEERLWQSKIIGKFLEEHRTKYMKGAREHSDNGLLQEIPPEQLIEFAIEEVLDLVSYLYTLREITTTNVATTKHTPQPNSHNGR